MIKKFFTLLLLIIVAALFILWIGKERIASSALSSALDAKVKIEKLDLSLDSITAKGVFIRDNATKMEVAIGRAYVQADLSDLIKNPVHIKKIDLSGLNLKSNLNILKTTKLLSKDDSPSESSNSTSKDVIVDHFIATDIKMTASAPLGLGDINFKTSKIEIRDFNSNINESLDKFLAKVLKKLN